MPKQVHPVYPKSIRRKFDRRGFYHPVAILVLAAITLSFAIIFYLNSSVFFKAPEKDQTPTITSSPSPLTQKSPNEIEGVIVDEKVELLAEFTTSMGSKKYVVSKNIGLVNGLNTAPIYLSASKTSLKNEVLLYQEPGIEIKSNPTVSQNTGVKYIVIGLGAGDGVVFFSFDENGKKTGVDLSNYGLGTTVPGQYGLSTSGWIPNTTTFKVKAVSANGHTYEGLFEANTGKQVGETKQVE